MLFVCLYDKTWFCYVQLACHIHLAHVTVYFTHVTLLTLKVYIV